MHGDAFFNGGREFRDAAKHTATQPFGGDVAEETLDHVEPGGRRGRKVHVKARLFGKPGLHLGMLMGGIVVTDEMQLFVFGCFAVGLTQEGQPLGVAVALLALADDLTVQHAQGGKQGCGAVALIRVIVKSGVWQPESGGGRTMDKRARQLPAQRTPTIRTIYAIP